MLKLSLNGGKSSPGRKPGKLPVEDKNKEIKEKCIGLIRETPVITAVCHQCGIGRSTLYRWKNEDETFCREFEAAFRMGKEKVNDMAESGLISNIKDRDNTAIIFWLKNNHPGYRMGGLNLTDEDKRLILDKIDSFPIEDNMKKLYRELFEGQINGSVLKVLISLMEIGLKDRNLNVKRGKILKKTEEIEKKEALEKDVQDTLAKYR